MVRAQTDLKVYGPFDDAIKDWSNDDLVLTDEYADFLKSQFPEAISIFVWPEFRELFGRLDESAKRLKRRSQRFGRLTLCMGFVSLVLAAFSPLIVAQKIANLDRNSVTTALGVTSAACAALCVIMGLYHSYVGKGLSRWLRIRYVAERLRHFYFQIILRYLPTIAEDLTHPERPPLWPDLRNRLLEKFAQQYTSTHSTEYQRLLADVGETSVPVFEEWERLEPADVVAPSDAVRRLMDILLMQRLGIQIKYCHARLTGTFSSPKNQYGLFKISTVLFTILILMATVAKGILQIVAIPNSTFIETCLGVCLAVVSSVVVLLVAANDGFQMGASAERLEWYLAALEAIKPRANQSDLTASVSILEETERLAYAETRKFMISQKSSKFWM